jgi:transcriptional regulator GlxA family with amidase domain
MQDLATPQKPIRIAILTLDGFNEIDSFVAQHILYRVRQPGWEVLLAAPTPTVTSMNGVVVSAQMSTNDLPSADAVIVGSGIRTRDFANDATFLRSLQLDPTQQLIGSQCSGALLLAKLGLLTGIPACTDLRSKPWVIEAGVEVLNQPFFAAGNVATAGGCLSSQYLAAWIIATLVSEDAAAEAIHYVAPVGEKEEYVERALANIGPFLPASNHSALLT